MPWRPASRVADPIPRRDPGSAAANSNSLGLHDSEYSMDDRDEKKAGMDDLGETRPGEDRPESRFERKQKWGDASGNDAQPGKSSPSGGDQSHEKDGARGVATEAEPTETVNGDKTARAKERRPNKPDSTVPPPSLGPKPALDINISS